jgi:BarA-like signal transduction histidine kinase
LRRRLYRHANACLIAPLSRQRLVVASSPLSPRQCLSCRAVASLVAPPPLSLDATSPLSLRRRLYRHANACLITPLSRQRLVVESSPLSRRQCLSCRALSSLPFSLRRRLFGS